MERADPAGPATGMQGPQLAEHLGGGGFLRAGPAASRRGVGDRGGGGRPGGAPLVRLPVLNRAEGEGLAQPLDQPAPRRGGGAGRSRGAPRSGRPRVFCGARTLRGTGTRLWSVHHEHAGEPAPALDRRRAAPAVLLLGPEESVAGVLELVLVRAGVLREGSQEGLELLGSVQSSFMSHRSSATWTRKYCRPWTERVKSCSAVCTLSAEQAEFMRTVRSSRSFEEVRGGPLGRVAGMPIPRLTSTSTGRSGHNRWASAMATMEGLLLTKAPSTKRFPSTLHSSRKYGAAELARHASHIRGLQLPGSGAGPPSRPPPGLPAGGVSPAPGSGWL